MQINRNKAENDNQSQNYHIKQDGLELGQKLCDRRRFPLVFGWNFLYSSEGLNQRQ